MRHYFSAALTDLLSPPPVALGVRHFIEGFGHRAVVALRRRLRREQMTNTEFMPTTLAMTD